MKKETYPLAAQADKLFCPSCGEQVEYFVMLSEGDEIKHCSVCGLILHEEAAAAAAELKTLQHVVAAGDSMGLVKTVSRMLVEKNTPKWVAACKNGEEFIATAVERIKKGQPISLAILDPLHRRG